MKLEAMKLGISTFHENPGAARQAHLADLRRLVAQRSGHSGAGYTVLFRGAPNDSQVGL